MKKKIALIITIAVCIVSVSANVYQYRVIRNKDAQIVWNQTTEDQMFQGILGHIQEEILYLQTCEPDEKDFMEYLERNMMFIIWWLSLEIIWKIYSPMKHCGKMQRVVT